jgi:spore germination cell wall hydrolase CwlJ-like protein
MTVLRFQGWRPAQWRLLHWASAIAVVVAAVIVAVLLTLRAAATAASVQAQLPPAQAAALIRATSGEATLDMRAVGEDAKLINAALPFSSGPNHSARPFHTAGSNLDASRAELCLTQAVYYEAGFEPVDGRRAVAQVVLNRVRHPAYPKSICGVVYQRSASNICQFTFVCDGALYRAPARAAWQQARAVAQAALAGYVEPSVGQATHYHAEYVSPRWAPMLAKVAKLGQHIFYRWPGAWGRPAAFSGRYAGEPRDPLALRPAAPTLLPGGDPLAGDAFVAGPPVARAENDVGGLLDTTKGWTLTIPGPADDSAAARLIARQEGRPAPVPAKTAEAAIAATPGS